MDNTLLFQYVYSGWAVSNNALMNVIGHLVEPHDSNMFETETDKYSYMWGIFSTFNEEVYHNVVDQYRIWMGADLTDVESQNVSADVDTTHYTTGDIKHKKIPLDEDLKKKIARRTPSFVISVCSRFDMLGFKKNTITDSVQAFVDEIFHEKKGSFSRVWGAAQYNRDVDAISEFRRSFAQISVWHNSAFKTEFTLLVNMMNMYLTYSGVYDEYPTFKNKLNLSALIAFRERSDVINFMNNLDSIRTLIEYDSFPHVWDCFTATI